jgi:hypothetical protein
MRRRKRGGVHQVDGTPEAINRQLDTFKSAIAHPGAKVEEAFVPVLAPGWLDHFIFNEYYKTEEEFLFALAEPCARNIALWWRQGSYCRSTILVSPTGGIC